MESGGQRIGNKSGVVAPPSGFCKHCRQGEKEPKQSNLVLGGWNSGMTSVSEWTGRRLEVGGQPGGCFNVASIV